jgi:hypothetical protein
MLPQRLLKLRPKAALLADFRGDEVARPTRFERVNLAFEGQRSIRIALAVAVKI